MMEIKFRAWDKKEKIMLKSMLYEGCVCFGFMPEEEETVKTNWDNKNLEIMQYTGLKDKNGNSIYEGDIVRKSNIDYIIKFKEYWGAFIKINVECKDTPILSEVDSETIIQSECRRIEIIGNIYEDSNLIK